MMRGRRGWVRAGWLAFAIILGAAGFWAGRTIGRPAADPLPTPPTTTYQVQNGTVGRTINLSAAGSWGTTVVAKAASTGTVTAVDVKPGQTVHSGDVLMSVDLRPVVVLAGTVPAFRDMTVGTAGPDVKQLQQYLASRTPGPAVTGTFDDATRDAVTAWQRALGGIADGVVRRGDVAFIPDLPRRVTLAPAIVTGATLTPGADLVAAVAAVPSVQLQLTSDQATMVPPKAQVVLHHGSQTWTGIIGATSPTQAGQVEAAVTASDGAPVCGSDCAAAIPLGDPTVLPADVVVIPPTSGPVVPVAAITTSAGNKTTVTTVDSRIVPVTVVTSWAGLAVVSGIESGAELLIPAAPSGS